MVKKGRRKNMLLEFPIIPIDLPLITVLAAISFMYMITGCMKLRTILFLCAGSLAHDSLEDRV